jgi:hypothetical protein
MSAHKLFRTSLIKFCQDQLQAMIMDGTISSGEFVDFDAHSQLDKLPEENLIGVANLHWVNDTDFYTVGAMIGVSTWRDTNLFVHNDMIDWLEPKLLPMKTIALVDPTDGSEQGWMVAEAGTSLMPMLHTDTRSLQFFMVSWQTSQTA